MVVFESQGKLDFVLRMETHFILKSYTREREF